MSIRWDPNRVKEAADLMEEYVRNAESFLQEAIKVAQEAQKIPNLPGYVSQYFSRFIFDIKHSIGGITFGNHVEPGQLYKAIADIRNALPKEPMAGTKQTGTMPLPL